MVRYSALIRTFNSADTLPGTLQSLAAQTIPPSNYVFVDSGSTDNTLTLFPERSEIHHFIGKEFNFAGAINQGLSYVSTDYVLIISSHTLLRSNIAIEYALNLLIENDDIGAAYFSYDNNHGELRHLLINKANFDGFNGLYNTCSVIKMDLLRRRNFREDVFSAEDQEWAKWLFSSEGKMVARVDGVGLDHNRNMRVQQYSTQKRKNEYVSTAYFTNRQLLNVTNLARIGYRVIKPTTQPFAERSYNLKLLVSLLACFVRKPKYKSRYFKP
jgi:glycosyltransferase involved in cell wall biosynthesis